MGRISFTTGEVYHVYNRGVEKRNITQTHLDSDRFEKSLRIFNTIEPVGSLFRALNLREDEEGGGDHDPLVKVLAYCLNKNHFHLVLQQVCDGGIGEYLKRVVGGYTNYFNYQHDRTGVLFQGRSKARHVRTTEELLYVASYVTHNDTLHYLRGRTPQVVRTCRPEFRGERSGHNAITNPTFVLGSYDSPSVFLQIAKRTAKDVARRRAFEKGLTSLLIE